MNTTQKRVLIVGATGYLGQHLINAYTRAGYMVRALARNPEKLASSGLTRQAIFVGEATDPASLAGCCDEIDLVVSAMGITKQNDGLTYEQVDYQANRNLLDEALEAGVKQFAYVHLLNAEKMPNVAVASAKEKFAIELRAAPIASTILRPSGFFSDLIDIYKMANKGRVYLFGDGSAPMTPIDGADLADLCVVATEAEADYVDVGGPETFTQNEIARLAFNAVGKQVRITHIPLWVGDGVVWLAKAMGFGAAVGPIELFVTASGLDMSASHNGTRRLSSHFGGPTGIEGAMA